MELKTINRAIAIAMGESIAPDPVNYFDDGPQEKRFIGWADGLVKELGLTEDLAELQEVPLGDHSEARWRVSVLQLWRFLPPSQ